jgi:LytS/YehU family sensor histidine kinase
MRDDKAMPQKTVRISLSFWKLNFVAWITVGLLCDLAKVYFYPNLTSGLALLLANCTLALLLSGLLRQAYRHTEVGDFFKIKTLGVLMTGSLIAGLIQAEIIQSLVNHMDWGHPNLPGWLTLSLRRQFLCLLFLSWSLGYYGLRAKVAADRALRRSRQARAEARHFELQLLRNRVDPHFLFNSLNGIAAEITPHPDTASELVHDVSDYLRYLLDHRDQASSPLSEELDAMESYLKIEKSRFEERLHTKIESSRLARKTHVPCFLLQGLVENAIKHARWPEGGPLEIAIQAAVEDGKLMIDVTNTGALKEGSQDGVGLSTLKRLLELQYPGRHEFTLGDDQGVVRATLKLQGSPCSDS